MQHKHNLIQYTSLGLKLASNRDGKKKQSIKSSLVKTNPWDNSEIGLT